MRDKRTPKDVCGVANAGDYNDDDNSEFTQQDGRKKRTAKRLSVTNVTGLLLACFVGNSLNIDVFCSSSKRYV